VATAPNQGGIVKLSIEAYQDPGFSTRVSDPANPFLVDINPAGYGQTMAVDYSQEDAAGGTGQSNSFNRDCGVSLTLDFVFDGTGAVAGASGRSVTDQIGALRRLGLQINSSTHEPNYLKLSWGTLLFKGRLQQLKIDYTLFAPDGSPLRAKVAATFIGFHENLDGRAAQNLNSPDMTHFVRVEGGDTLPLLAYRIYGDSAYAVDVARVNDLDGFRALAPGTALTFPPLSGSDG
jgi:nucleoid-associated protein YgaU